MSAVYLVLGHPLGLCIRHGASLHAEMRPPPHSPPVNLSAHDSLRVGAQDHGLMQLLIGIRLVVKYDGALIQEAPC